jgi:hypothetical protein
MKADFTFGKGQQKNFAGWEFPDPLSALAMERK